MISWRGNNYFGNPLRLKEHEWKEREWRLQRHISQITRDFEESSHNLQAKLRESESEKLVLREEHNAFIRKQQKHRSDRWNLLDGFQWMKAKLCMNLTG